MRSRSGEITVFFLNNLVTTCARALSLSSRPSHTAHVRIAYADNLDMPPRVVYVSPAPEPAPRPTRTGARTRRRRLATSLHEQPRRLERHPVLLLPLSAGLEFGAHLVQSLVQVLERARALVEHIL